MKLKNIIKKLDYISIITILVIIILDQVTKNLVINHFSIQNSDIIIVNSVFNIVLVKNRGITFGLFNNILFGRFIFSVIGIITVFFLIKYSRNINKKHVFYAFNLVIAGAIGNIIDRLRWGAVIDFLDFHYRQYHWYSFNIADSVICFGVAILMFEEIFKSETKKDLL